MKDTKSNKIDAEIQSIKILQILVRRVWSRSKKRSSAYTNILFLIEEVGEIAEALRKNRRGDKQSKKTDLEKEFGDVFFSLLTLANENKIDLENGFRRTLKEVKDKYCM